MAVRLQIEPWGRLPDLTRPPPEPRRERSSLAWAVPYWIAALAFAYAAHADWVPVRSWLESLLVASRAGAPAEVGAPAPDSEPPPVISEAEARRSAMGVFTAADEEERYAALHTDDWEREAIEPEEEDESDEGDEGDEAARAEGSDEEAEVAQRTAESSVAPAPANTAVDEERVARLEPAVSEPSPDSDVQESRPRSRREALAAAVDEALGISSGRRRFALLEPDEPEHATPVPRRSKRVRRGKALSCEAAIASYQEEWKIGQGSGPRDLTAEQYGAVLNGGGYFRHCGVPGRIGVKICAAVQNGQAVGVTVTTSPPSSKIRRCIASAVRGLSFPSHPRMDVTTTVFKPAR